MAVELWYGEKPVNAGEQNVLIELIQFLESREGRYVVLCNFHAGSSNEIDILVLKKDAIFLAEVKHWWNQITGSKEGAWHYVREDGSRGKLTNPYRQVRKAYAGWRDWARTHASEISEGINHSNPIEFDKTLQFIVVYPDLHPDSKLDIGAHPVQVSGLQKFLIGLPIRSVPGIHLSGIELSRIPQLLKLTRWHILTAHNKRPTVRLDMDDWQAPQVRMLVARGHEYSEPVLYLDARERFSIGRDEDSDLTIRDDSVSRQHAVILHHGGKYIVEDLNSTNGTFISFSGNPHLERKLEGRNALKNGSIVRFGQASYTLLLND